MPSQDFDVVIVGASIAGCTAATLFGRRGLRVLLIERASDPQAYKKVCTHFIQASANPVLRRLGVEDPMLRAGALRNYVETWSPYGWIPWPEGAEPGYNIRREVLDPMLRQLAVQTPGVTLWLGHSAQAVIEEHGRIAGVTVTSKQAGPREVRAKLVVAADGRQGKLGELAGVPAKHSSHGRLLYFAYYEGLKLPSGNASMAWWANPDAAYCFPNDAGKTVVAVMPTKDKLPAFRADIEGAFTAMVEALPHAPQLRAARRVSDFMGMLEMPNHSRPAAKRGMAFIGDAALTSDPLFGVGCGWAMQSAEWLADTVGPALAAHSPASELEPALQRYAKLHRAELGEHHKLIADASTGRRFNTLEQALFRGASRDDVIARGFVRFATRLIQPAQLLTPATLLRLASVNMRKSPRVHAPRSHGNSILDPKRPVVLQKFLPAWGLPDISPFCFKVEVYLKLAGIPYTTVLGDSRKAPKGKLPVLLEGERTLADSSAILDYLERSRGKRMDAFLTVRQTAIATAVKAMLEEQLYFVIVYQRWHEARNWDLYKSVFSELARQLGIPHALQGLIVPQIRKQMLAALRGQGFGRHTPEEITAIGIRTLDAVSTLCTGPFFFGAEPSTLDATVYAFLESIRGAPFEGPLVEHLRADPKLMSYCDHMQRIFQARAPAHSQETIASFAS